MKKAIIRQETDAISRNGKTSDNVEDIMASRFRASRELTMVSNKNSKLFETKVIQMPEDG